MKEILRVINELKSTSGKNDKEDIIKNNLDNELFVEMMKFLLNDFILTGISKKKIDKKINRREDLLKDEIMNILGAFDYLSKNNTGKDYDISVIQYFILKQPDELQDLYKQLITKDLKLGVSAKTWNKIASKENQIPVFELMLAKKFEDHSHKIKGDFGITKKLDGTRIVVIKEGDTIKSYTRKGKEYIGLQEIESDVAKIPYDIMLDGELLADTEGNTNEIFTETLKKSRNKDENKTGLIFHIFDAMPPHEFKKGKSSDNFVYRKQALSQIFKDYEFEYLEEVKSLYTGSDFSEIAKWSDHADKQEWEGIMVNLDKPYVCKRTDSLLKVKGMQTCDLKIVGFEEGEGRNKGKLGAIVCEYKDNTVKVGSGFSDIDREEIWNNQDDWCNTIIEVQFFEESKDSKTGLLSLRFPVFKHRRLDKNEPSYN